MAFEQWKDSKILFRPVEEFERLRGTNLAWFGIDELTYAPEEAWLRLEARLRDPVATRMRLRGMDSKRIRLGLLQVCGGNQAHELRDYLRKTYGKRISRCRLL
jgi:hypothetical protein